ncbi:MAG: sigma-70 family RNA polymerase sigma factor, partial [Lentisphaeraceae bacterium]|nr:sigma-70 family RNA polymerase sigma factor [Lentisphaeraceae bacterium]
MKSNEEQLINLIKSGKQDIFTDLAYPYYNQAFSIAYNILKQYQDAEDATQNSYIKAFKSIYTFNGQSPFKHWLFRIVKNQAIDTYRSNQKLGNKKDAFRTIITVDSLLIGQTSNVKIQYSKNEISFVVNK